MCREDYREELIIELENEKERLIELLCECHLLLCEHQEIDPMEWNKRRNDIIVCNFGYNCHLVNFYKVVGVTKSGKSVKIKQLKEKVVSHDGYGQAGLVVPSDEFNSEKVLTRKIQEGSWKPYIKVEDYMYGYKWDGKEVAFDSYD